VISANHTKKNITLIHSVMQKEVLTLLKSLAVVVVGVLIANQIEKKYMATKVTMPEVATKE
jgi:hypothetical protein